MNNYALSGNLEKQNLKHKINCDAFYSLEFAIKGLSESYQFKIWNIASTCLWILVKENSDLLTQIKEGDIFDIKCYSTDSADPLQYYRSVIRQITKNEHGRIRGHYLVGMEILEKSKINTIKTSEPTPLFHPIPTSTGYNT